MVESFRTRLERVAFNFFPAYFGTGARITFIAATWREVRVEVPHSLRTRNYVGTIFGGSMYGAVDPILMLMLIKNLGPAYVVWDKAASIRFLRPGRSTLRVRFEVNEAELDAIRHALATRRSVNRVYTVRLVDEDGVACAEVEKTIYVRRAAPPDPLDGEAERSGATPAAPPEREPTPAPPARRRARPARRPPPPRRPRRPRR
jgi:acyl-coenzyme A thioesterase PaaI-like protein